MTINTKRNPGEDVYLLNDGKITRGRIKTVTVIIRNPTSKEYTDYNVLAMIESEIYLIAPYPDIKATQPYENHIVKRKLPDMYSNIQEVLQKIIDDYEKI